MGTEDVPRDVDRLLSMNALMRLMMERRQTRSPEDPTRLQALLLNLIDRTGGLAVADLVQYLEISPTTVSQMVTHLETRGWVERRFDPADRRRHRVHLTGPGHETVAAVYARRRARLGAILSELTPAERTNLVALAERIATIVQRNVETESRKEEGKSHE